MIDRFNGNGECGFSAAIDDLRPIELNTSPFHRIGSLPYSECDPLVVVELRKTLLHPMSAPLSL